MKENQAKKITLIDEEFNEERVKSSKVQDMLIEVLKEIELMSKLMSKLAEEKGEKDQTIGYFEKFHSKKVYILLDQRFNFYVVS